MPISPRLHLHWLPALAFMTLIYSLSSLPGPQVGAAFEPLNRSYPAPRLTIPAPESRRVTLEWPKVGHVIGYVGLGGAWLYTLRREQPLRRVRNGPEAQPLSGDASRAWRVGLLALLLAAAYAVTDEFHQSFVPGRSAALADVALDTAAALGGVLLGGLAGWAVGRVRAQFRAPEAQT